MRNVLLPAIAFAVLVAPCWASITSADIDLMMQAEWEEAKVEPAATATDAEFLRRLSLDVRGVIPSADETIAFLADKSADKRSRVIEEYLQSTQRGQHWAEYWDKLLVGNGGEGGGNIQAQRVKQQWKEWVAEQFNSGASYSDFVRAIVTAEGIPREAPQASPLARWRGAPENMAGSISRVFLGTQIQCAQCHDHKTTPELTQTKFWEFAAFFANVKTIPVRDPETGKNSGIEVVEQGIRWESDIPEVQPKVTVSPAYLDGTKGRRDMVDPEGNLVDQRDWRKIAQEFREVRKARNMMQKDTGAEMAPIEIPRYHDTRRQQLAHMMVNGDADQVSRNFVNRLWARFFGRGILDPVDEWYTGGEPSNPRLLEALANEFVESGWNVRHMESLLLNTRAYQLSSIATESSSKHSELFAHAQVRPLTPDQLFSSLIQATSFEAVARKRSKNDEARMQRLMERYEAGFVFLFDNDEMEVSSDFQNSIPQALMLMNDQSINEALGYSKGSTLERIGKTTKKPDEIVDYAYLAALTRRPTAEERRTLARDIDEAMKSSEKQGKEYVSDLYWALLNSAEFMTNH